ncbi:MAG: hypothetical protein WAL25_12775, partial [Acidimicrobiia bacterium]
TLAWIVALMIQPSPLEPVPALLTGLGLLGMSTVATVGMIVVHGRWAHRLGVLTMAFTMVLAVIRPIDFIWFIALALSTAAIVALLSPPVMGGIRRLPSASGPPPRAVTPPLLLLMAPVLLGLVGNGAQPWALLVVGLSAPSVALLYSRVVPGGLLGIRLIWPLLALGLTPWMGWLAGSVSAALAIAVAATSWHQSVRASYHPPQEAGTTFAIPPELAPTEILDAAQIDERGRPK